MDSNRHGFHAANLLIIIGIIIIIIFCVFLRM